MAEEEKNQEESSEQENTEEKEENTNEDSQQKESEESEQEEVSQEDLAAQWANMVEEGGEEQGGESEEDLAAQWENMVESKQTETTTAQETQEEFDEKLSVLMDIPLEVSVEIGSTSLPIEEVLKLSPNKIVEFDKDINKPVDIKINGKLVAQGELYTVKNHFGVRITNIITLKERLKLLDDFS
jgi:flagellar motor switch protein FliN/FliY